MCRNNSEGGAFHSAQVADNDTILSGRPTSRMPVAGIRGVEHLPTVLGRSLDFNTVCVAHGTARVTRDIGAGLP